jgi:hypothetical protein
VARRAALVEPARGGSEGGPGRPQGRA